MAALNPGAEPTDSDVMTARPHRRIGPWALIALGLATISLLPGCRTLDAKPSAQVAAPETSLGSVTTRRTRVTATSMVAAATTIRVTSATTKIAPAPTTPGLQPRRTGYEPGGDRSGDLGGATTTIPPTTIPPTTVIPTTTTAVGTVLVKVRQSPLGAVLTDGINHTLYASATDTAGAGTCVAPCTDQWVPISGQNMLADAGVESALLGRITRVDGVVQLTYNGRPLYRLNNEPLGDIMGHGDAATWYVVDPAGNLIPT